MSVGFWTHPLPQLDCGRSQSVGLLLPAAGRSQTPPGGITRTKIQGQWTLRGIAGRVREALARVPAGPRSVVSMLRGRLGRPARPRVGSRIPSEVAEATCDADGGSFEGHGTDCASTSCPMLPGACCLVDGTCQNVADQAACAALSGTFKGHGTDCASTSCLVLPGACCLANGICQEVADPAACDADGGVFEGHGTDCASTSCPVLPGACCLLQHGRSSWAGKSPGLTSTLIRHRTLSKRCCPPLIVFG